MLLPMCISSYGYTWEVGKALKKLELFSAVPRATAIRFPPAVQTSRVHKQLDTVKHAKDEPIH